MGKQVTAVCESKLVFKNIKSKHLNRSLNLNYLASHMTADYINFTRTYKLLRRDINIQNSDAVLSKPYKMCRTHTTNVIYSYIFTRSHQKVPVI